MARRPSYGSGGAVPGNSSGSPDRTSPQINQGGLSYPKVLDPDFGPQSIHRPDLFFINPTPHMNTRQNTEYSSPQSSTSPASNQLYPYHQQGFHHFTQHAPPPRPLHNSYGHDIAQHPNYVQRSWTQPTPPPVPAKPNVYPPIGAVSTRDSFAYPAASSGRYDNIPSTTYATPIDAPHVATSSSAATFAPPTHSATSIQKAYDSAPPPVTHPPQGSFQPAPPYADVASPTQPTPLSILPPSLPSAMDTVTSPTDDSDELAIALAISQSESNQRKFLEEQMLDQEAEDLARALAESMCDIHVLDNNPFLVAPEKTASTSTIMPGQSKIHLSPLELPTDLPSVVRPTTQPIESLSYGTDPEFGSGRYDKWRIPSLPSSSAPENEDRPTKPSPISPPYDPQHRTPEKATTRPLSISSVSSLPYTLPSGDLERRNSLPQYAQMEDNEVYPDSLATEQLSPAALAALESVRQTEAAESVLVFDDEAYARQLAAEEEEELSRLIDQKGRAEAQSQEPVVESLPIYSSQESEWAADSHSNIPSSSAISAGSSSHSLSNMYPTGPVKDTRNSSSPYFPGYASSSFSSNQYQPQQYASLPALSTITSTSSLPLSSSAVHPPLGPRRESEADARSEVSHQSSSQSYDATYGSHPERPHGRPHANTYPPPMTGPSDGAQPNHAANLGVLNANHFLDDQLLMGVSIGFRPPAISPKLLPMQDAMPNIISLPYARCPPLHLQAPDWRHLLRLMARLSGTRIEPTVEAMAVSKAEHKLRTVVQFIKPHPNANAWRAVLWFSIDHPVPPSAPGAYRYRSGNTNLLPWSYTLSPVPMLLRDAADTQLSKTYTIPVSESVPLPTLPITFPNLALYLQAALEASRRQSSDNAAGLGKLGKMVQACYPNAKENAEDDFDIPERSGARHLFKRVIGRAKNEKRKGKGTSNNEETYQLVTPFVAEEWG